jgi:LuxR family maltose regulon positive regulatory protein
MSLKTALPVLVTKLHIPRSGSNLVTRSALMDRLNSGLVGKLTLVTAPAGFGKTTLVTDWLSNGLPDEYRDRIGWLSLDTTDNSAAQYWNYVIAALQTIDDSLGKVPQMILQSSAAPPVRAVLTSLINEIAALSDPLLLGLDDYHEINSADIHNEMEFLIENLPPNLHLVIMTREDPPITLSRMRVQGLLTEIRADDLRFSKTESTTFFNDLLALALTQEDVDALIARTEGWIAGLQLAAISLKNAADKSEFVRAFAGSHRFLTDYLVDEVLSRQTPEAQKFLRRTSILERFCAGLCDTLVEEVESREILQQLGQANLFLVSLDNDLQWFRYHHLFAEFLQLQLYEQEPEIVPELYRRTIEWFIQASLPRDALHYALKAEDNEQAADLIEGLAPDILTNDNHELVIRWSEQLPQELVKQRPYLCVYLGWAWSIVGQLETASQWLDAAESHRDRQTTDESNIIIGHVYAHRAYINLLHGETEAASDFALRALDLLPPDAVALRGRTITCLGQSYIYGGRLAEAKIAFHEAIAIAKQIGSLPLGMFSYGGLGEALREEGNLFDALDTYNHLVQFAEDLTGHQNMPLTGYAQAAIGIIMREQNDLDGAVEQIRRGVDLCREWQQGEGLAVGLIELAETYRLRGEITEAESTLTEARHLANGMSPWAQGLADGFSARLALSRGEIEAAARWAERAGLLDSCEMVSFERFSECIPLIRLLITKEEADRALAFMAPLIERERTCGRYGRLLDLLVLRTVALDSIGESREALEVLGEAVELGGPSKHVRPFIEYESILVPYLEKLLPSAHRDRLLAVFGAKAESAGGLGGEVLAEPLNDREVTILRLMSAGRSNREIGDELYLSVNTIRWYASQIYMKLGAKNRGEAVAIARELGII